MLKGTQLRAHRDQVKKRRQVLEQVVKVIGVLRKRGLSYGQDEGSAAYTLDNCKVDIGNFWRLSIGWEGTMCA